MANLQQCVVDAVLFDMDGTLVDSTPAVDRTYIEFCKANGIELTRHPHGIRTQDNMRMWFPQATEDDIAKKVVQFEQDIVNNAQALEAAGKTGLIILPGVQRILEEIRANPVAEEHYAICTSATHVYASNALKTTGITPPSHFLTAEQCTYGKPHPEPYLKGAAMLNKDIKKCLVVEDAPSGIKSGLDAGAIVLAVCTSHSRDELKDLGAHYMVDNLENVHFEWTQDGNYKVIIPQ